MLNKLAPIRKKFLTGNHTLYITKPLRKAIMHRPQLETKYFKIKTQTESITTFVVSYTKGKEENIMSP